MTQETASIQMDYVSIELEEVQMDSAPVRCVERVPIICHSYIYADTRNTLDSTICAFSRSFKTASIRRVIKSTLLVGEIEWHRVRMKEVFGHLKS